MKKVRKVLAMMLVLTMVFTTFSACGDGGHQGGEFSR